MSKIFFDLETGEVTETGGQKCLWIAGALIFFSIDNLMFSIALNRYKKIRLEQFKELSYLIEDAVASKEYIDNSNVKYLLNPYIAFEDEDEGTRNLCFRDKYIFNIINLDVKILAKLEEFFREESLKL